jgi:hypothetical protein
MPETLITDKEMERWWWHVANENVKNLNMADLLKAAKDGLYHEFVRMANEHHGVGNHEWALEDYVKEHYDKGVNEVFGASTADKLRAHFDIEEEEWA